MVTAEVRLLDPQNTLQHVPLCRVVAQVAVGVGEVFKGDTDIRRIVPVVNLLVLEEQLQSITLLIMQSWLIKGLNIQVIIIVNG